MPVGATNEPNGFQVPAMLERVREPAAPAPPDKQAAASRLGRTSVDTSVLNAVLAGTVLALLVRLHFVLGSDFPLNDGGLFYIMIRDLQANRYLLPEFTTYNHDLIPFIYPPLAFYLGSLLDALGATVESTLRVVPLVASLASGFSLLWLARRILQSDRASAFAFWSFLLLPAGYVWMIMGGGLTRSLGMLFALTFLAALHRYYSRPTWKLLPPLILLATLTVLSHLEWAYFAFYSGGLFFVLIGRHRAGVAGSVLVCLATTAATAPWWAVALSNHGFAPFVAAFSGSDFDWPLLSGLRSLALQPWTEEPFFPLFGTLAAMGALRAVITRQTSVLLWLLAIAVFDPKGGPSSDWRSRSRCLRAWGWCGSSTRCGMRCVRHAPRALPAR
jgi:hypothetical protein